MQTFTTSSRVRHHNGFFCDIIGTGTACETRCFYSVASFSPNSRSIDSPTTARSSRCSVSVRPFALPRRLLQLTFVSLRLASGSCPLGSTNSYDLHSVLSHPVPREFHKSLWLAARLTCSTSRRGALYFVTYPSLCPYRPNPVSGSAGTRRE